MAVSMYGTSYGSYVAPVTSNNHPFNKALYGSDEQCNRVVQDNCGHFFLYRDKEEDYRVDGFLFESKQDYMNGCSPIAAVELEQKKIWPADLSKSDFGYRFKTAHFETKKDKYLTVPYVKKDGTQILLPTIWIQCDESCSAFLLISVNEAVKYPVVSMRCSDRTIVFNESFHDIPLSDCIIVPANQLEGALTAAIQRIRRDANFCPSMYINPFYLPSLDLMNV